MYQQDQQIADVAPRALSHDIVLGCSAAGSVQVATAPVARTVGRRSARSLSEMLASVQVSNIERLRCEIAEADKRAFLPRMLLAMCGAAR